MTRKTSYLTLEDLKAARRRTREGIIHTPLVFSDASSQRSGIPVFLKLESLQRTGSFKVRGALAKVTSLKPAERRRGLVCASTGNHGAGVAYAAARFGVPSVVVLPENANPHKTSLLCKLGAKVVSWGVTSCERQNKADELSQTHGYVQVHPFSDPTVIAGQGTVGLEILEDLPHLEEVYIPIGGGGLISGICVAIKEQRPRARIYGVEPKHSNAMWMAIKQGGPVPIARVETVADGLAAKFTEDLNFSIVSRFVEDVILVSDQEILRAMLFLLEQGKVLAEPSGAASLAGLFANRKRRGKAVAIISGGNVTLGQVEHYLKSLRVEEEK